MERAKMGESETVVFSSLNIAEVFLVRSLLTREGIESRIRRTFLSPLAGEIPMDDARIELMVSERDLARASELLEEAKQVDGPDRSCPSCGELNPPSFELCWACGDDLE